MLITQKSLSDIREASITEIVSHFIDLKKQGKTSCPFHGEKTPSFTVTETKGIYKCFGCGRSGDAIQFVMEKEGIGFIEAVEKIASLTGVQLEYQEVQDKEKYQQEKAEADLLKNTLKLAVDRYKDLLWKMPEDSLPRLYLAKRGITKDDIIEWGLGWAGKEWSFITGSLKQQNLSDPAQKLGLIRRRESGDSHYDAYRGRITIPIQNHNGETVGLAGRWILKDTNGDQKNPPAKYINPPENPIYSKNAVLFGLDRAAKAIRQQGFAFLVEGYFDVLSMHKNGDENTVASCGTALTLKQVDLLKKHTGRVTLLGDGDTPGLEAAKKDIPLLLKAGFQVDIMLLPPEQDPASFISGLGSKELKPLSRELQAENAIMWQVKLWVTEADGNPDKLGMAKQDVVKLLSYISSDMTRSNYVGDICKKYGWKKTELQKQLSNILDEKKEEEASPQEIRLSKLPNWMDQEEYIEKGYSTVNNKSRTGYYTFGQGVQVEITNFIVKPLFHIYSGKDSRLLIQIENGRRKAILEIENSAFISKTRLQDNVVNEGNFAIHGGQPMWLRIASGLLEDFPTCSELKFLGWQEHGFFAFVDYIFVPGQGVLKLDEWGLAKYKNENYLIPAASAAYKAKRAAGDDPYENDQVLRYLKSDLSFSSWATLMNRVYLEKGIVAIAYIILTAFRDIIFSIDNNCPHLYAYGERSSGKSKWAESIAAVFFKGKSAFNLNSGTDPAFFLFMQRFKNCPALFNEFDRNVIRPEWFQALKGAFDGEGRQRGVMGNKNQTEIMKINSTIVLIGQYMVTDDDNSMISRSLIVNFNERKVTEEDKEKYSELKDAEAAGLSSLVCDILQYRDEFKARYKLRYNEVLSSWRKNNDGGSQGINQRTMQNWCHLYTSYDVLSKYVNLPESNEAFEGYCKQNILHWSSFLNSTSILSAFWDTFAWLVDRGYVIADWDFKIETKMQVRVRKEREEEEDIVSFNEPTKLLFLRMNNVHMQYLKALRQVGKEGMSIENLAHYMKSKPYYVGPIKNISFNRSIPKLEYTKTSCIVLRYSELNINIERTVSDNDEHEGDAQSGPPDWDAEAEKKDFPF